MLQSATHTTSGTLMAEDNHILFSVAYELDIIIIKVNNFEMPHQSQQLFMCINIALASETR